VGAVFGFLESLACRQGFAGGESPVGGGVGVDSGEVEEGGSSSHQNLAVREEVGEVLLDDMSKAVIATSELAEEVACVIMSDGNACAFELGATQSMPRILAEVGAVIAEETSFRHVVNGGQADPTTEGHARAHVREGRDGEMWVRPAQSRLVPARGEADKVRVGAGVAIQEGLQTGIVNLLGQGALEPAQRGEAGVVERDLVGVEGERCQACREVLAVEVRLTSA
jgi:hypothetical protein